MYDNEHLPSIIPVKKQILYDGLQEEKYELDTERSANWTLLLNLV